MTRASEAILLPAEEASARAVPEGGYIVASLRGEVRAWIGEDELSFVSLSWVRALSPHAVWFDTQPGKDGIKPATRGASKLWMEWKDLRVGPLTVELHDVPEPEWISPGKPRQLRCAVPLGTPVELRALARFVESLLQAGAAHAPKEGNLGREKVRDPDEIAEILSLFMREGRAGSLASKGERIQIKIASVDPAARTMVLDDSGATWTAPTMLEIGHLHAAFEIPLTHRPCQGEALAFPEWLSCRMRRRFRRAVAPNGLQVRFDHPYSRGLQIVAPLSDVSRAGFSFCASPADDLLYPGLPIGELLLSIGDEVVARVSGEVRSCRRDGCGGLAHIGVALEPGELGGNPRLRELIDAALYPSTHTQASEVWEVHASSGYLNLSGKTPDDFERVRSSFAHAAQKLAEAPAMASVAYWPARGPVQATISHFRAYQSTWLVCQLSKRKGGRTVSDSRTGIRDMYLRIYETAQADPEARWLLSYVQDLAPGWSRSVHVGIPQRYAAVGDGCLIPFRALEADVAGPPFARDGGRVQVTVADPVMARAAVRDLHRIRPAQYLDALDLTEGRLDLAVISAQWREAGLQRRREMFVAHIDGVRSALAVTETAEPGVHLYGLMDCLRMYPLRSGGEQCFPALFLEARTWFARQARDRFAYMEEFPVRPSLLPATFRDLGGATLTLLSVDRIPELMRRVADLASRRPPPPATTTQAEARS